MSAKDQQSICEKFEFVAVPEALHVASDEPDAEGLVVKQSSFKQKSPCIEMHSATSATDPTNSDFCDAAPLLQECKNRIVCTFCLDSSGDISVASDIGEREVAEEDDVSVEHEAGTDDLSEVTLCSAFRQDKRAGSSFSSLIDDIYASFALAESDTLFWMRNANG